MQGLPGTHRLREGTPLTAAEEQERVRLQIKLLHPDAQAPSYAHPGDAGLDLRSVEDIVLKPGQRAAIATGLAVAIPDGYAGFVHARSGRALKEGLALPNAPGLIDAGFRGELKVLLVNLDPDTPIEIRKGEKIAQMVIQKVENAMVEMTETLDETPRGEGGFGSTGI
ncbi:MAG: dUTP diphosphatase [Actinobacteria bacterium]|nr:dUTP diphosphatase [Actinomycetota bacterium]